MKRFVMLLATTAMLATPALAAKGKGKKGKGKKGGGRDITTEQGTMQLGGQTTLDIYSGGGSTDVGVSAAPYGGYFVADNIEILAGVNLGVLGGSTSWGVNAGLRYFIDMKPNWIYVGATGGYGSLEVAGFSVDRATISPHGGVLIPLDKNVGLDLGTAVNIYIADGDTSFYVPIGMLGVQAFFK